VKRVIITLTAMALFGALGSAARAQTPAQTAKWNRYMSRHPGVAQQAGVNPLATGVPNYMTNYPGSANSYNAASAAYQAKYQRNLATYQNYMAMHPGMAQQLAAQQGMTNGLPYGASYPGLQNYGGYANPMMQQLSSIPIVSSLAPMLGGYGGGGYGGGGYGGGMPAAQMPYAASSYPYSGASSYPYARAPYAQEEGMEPEFHHHHHWSENPGNGAGYGNGYGSAPGMGYQAMHPGARGAFFASHPYAAARHQQRWMRNH